MSSGRPTRSLASTLVLPFASHVDAARRALAVQGQALIGPMLLTFAKFEEGLALRLLPAAHQATPELTRALLLALLRSKPKTDVQACALKLNQDPDSPHVALALDQALSMLAEADVRAPQLERVLARDLKLAKRDRDRAQLLLVTLQALQTRLQELSSNAEGLGIRDGRWLSSELADALLEARQTPKAAELVQWLGRKVLVRDVLDLGPARLRLLEALAKLLSDQGGYLSLELPLARDQLFEAVALGAPDDSLAQRLERRLIGSDAPVRLDPRSIGVPLGASEDRAQGPLADVAGLCFTQGSAISAPEPTDTLRILLARNAQDEAEAVAHQVAQALRDYPDLSPECIRVVLGELDPTFVTLLDRALDAVHVPHQFERGQPPTQVPTVAWFLRLCESLVDRRVSRKTLIDAVASGFGAPLLRSDSGILDEADPNTEQEATDALDSLLTDLREVDVPSVGPESLGPSKGRARPPVDPKDHPLARALSQRQQERSALGRVSPNAEAGTKRLTGRLFLIRDALVAVATAGTRREALGAISHLEQMLRLDHGARRGLSFAVNETYTERRRLLLTSAARELGALQALRDSLQALQEATELARLGEQKPDLAGLIVELRQSLAGRGPSSGSAPGSVRIERLQRAIGRACEVLILAQTHDGLLPTHPQEDPLVTVGLREALARQEPLRCPSSPREKAAVPLLCALDSVASVRRRAAVIMRLHDDDGARVTTGPFVAELAYRAGFIGPGEDLTQNKSLRLGGRVLRDKSSWRLPSDVNLWAAQRRASDKAQLPPNEVSLGAAQCAFIEEIRRFLFSSRLAASVSQVLCPTDGLPWLAPTDVQNAYASLDGYLLPFVPDPSQFDLFTAKKNLISWQRELIGAYVSAEGRPVRPMSATTLEGYARCHFRSWVEHALGAKQVEETAEEIDERGRGRLIHRVLYYLYQALPAELWESPPTEPAEVLRSIPDWVQAALTLATKDEHTSDPMRVLEIEMVRVAVEDLLAWELRALCSGEKVPRHRPVALELAFGSAPDPQQPLQKSYGPLVLRSEDGKQSLVLRGRIDRVDMVYRGEATSYWVLDYKGSVANKMKCPPLMVTDLQLPVYALAVRALGIAEASRSASVDAALISYKRPEQSAKMAASVIKDPEDKRHLGGWDQALSTSGQPECSPFANRLVELFSKRLRLGFVTPTGGETACMGCGLRSACRRPRWQISVEEGADFAEGSEGHAQGEEAK